MKALVTGAGGFLGGAITRALIARGDTVHSFSRGDYPELAAQGVIQFHGDLGSEDDIAKAAAGCDAVFHVAAKAGSWGAYEDFYRTNVTGTENVISACQRHSIPSLVYTSSPSVVFDGGDMEGVDEAVPYPSHYEAHYPHTKSQAERLVLQANTGGLQPGSQQPGSLQTGTLQTVALRPHLIWGPRDTNIMPRLIQRSRSGQLRRISGPSKLVDVTYIDDAANAHLCAMDALRCDEASAARLAGKAYFISSGHPIPLWEMIDRMLTAAGEPKIARSISPRLAFFAGWVLENLHSILRRKGEPRMTRWVAQEMTTAHWFDISAARNDFGYQPKVSLEEGLQRLASWHEASHD